MWKLKSSLESIRKLFIKNEYNYKNIKTMSEIMSEVKQKQYQWKKGDSFGKIVTVESSDGAFTVFTDGSKIFNNVLNEFLEEVIDGSVPFPMPTKSIDYQKTLAKKNTPVIEEVSEVSPLHSLIDKLSKKNIAPFDTTINLNIPNTAVFNMLIENADENREDLIKTIASVAVSQIEINKLQGYLTEEIIKFVNNYYNE